MANAQGGHRQPQGQGGHGQTFTAAQHDKSLGRETQGPGVQHGSKSEGREVVERPEEPGDDEG